MCGIFLLILLTGLCPRDVQPKNRALPEGGTVLLVVILCVHSIRLIPAHTEGVWENPGGRNVALNYYANWTLPPMG